MSPLKALGLALVLAPLGACAPQAGPSAAASTADSLAIDSLYQTFRTAYATLNAAQVANLYHADATYGDPGSPGYTVGRDSILPGFERFFDAIRQEGATLELRFRFARRFRQDGLASDAGFYWMRRRWADSTGQASAGKFVTVMTKDSTGRWGFAVDSYSGAAVAAFLAAPEFEP